MTDSPLRLLIADDEEPARYLLKEYLAEHPAWELCGEARTGLEAVQLAQRNHPHLVLLDVQMPKLDGFEVLAVLPPGIAVIFVTAYDEYAVRAFEVHAIDYLLKPFSRERFAQALERARERLLGAQSVSAAPTNLSAQALSLARTVRAPDEHLERLVLRDGSEIRIVPVGEIVFARGQDDYVEVFHGGGSTLASQTLQGLESSLNPRRFVRVHRSYLLNLAELARVETSGTSSKVAVLRDGRTIPVSRSGEARLRAALGS